MAEIGEPGHVKRRERVPLPLHAPVTEPAEQPAPPVTVPAEEPAKTEPAKTEPAKTEPAKTEPAKTEPAKEPVPA